MTVVVERAGRRGAFDARDSTEIFVDRLQVMVGHILKRGPRHDLENITIEGRREAVCGYGSGTVWMQVLKVCSMPHDFQKFRKRGTPLRPASFVGRQIAGHNVRRIWCLSKRSEIEPAAQIGRRINFFRRRKKSASKIWV